MPLQNPVLKRLRQEIKLNGNPIREIAVVDYGTPFSGLELPTGYQQEPNQACFWNAACLALEDCGTYVEGFALDPRGMSVLVHHAWITLDGVHAIDPTWPDAPACAYYGIPFPTKVVARLAARKNGRISPVLDWTRPDLLAEIRSFVGK